MNDTLSAWIKKTLSVADGFSVEYPAHAEHGDFSTNVALIEAKREGKNPRELAEEYTETLRAHLLPEVVSVSVAGPGFINFSLSPAYFADAVSQSAHNAHVGENKTLAGKKISIEYTNTNVLKPLHIGHLMGNIIGESLAHIFETSGAEVKRNTYQGDVGLHIAKTVWGMKKLGGIKEGTLHDKIDYIGTAYATGAAAYEDDPALAEEIARMNEKLFKKSDEELNQLYSWARQVSLDHFEELYKKLGTKFDYYFFESDVADQALEIVRKFTGSLFEESDGAIVFKGEKFDPSLHTRVFVSSLGLPMYEAKDIAHALRKYKTYPFDKAIIITANEQDGYFKVVLRALAEIDKNVADKTEHLSHGMLRLPEGKMSSRKGNVITGESLITDLEAMALEKMKDREFDDIKKKEIATQVAVAAIKYSILKQTIGRDIVFDFNQSLSFEGDSGPYLQYSLVRARSVLKKAAAENLAEGFMPEGWVITPLEKYIERFPSIVLRAAEEYAPHHIVTYLTELAGLFNSFYAHHKIVDAADPASPYKLALTKSFANIMAKGLELLGIAAPEEM